VPWEVFILFKSGARMDYPYNLDFSKALVMNTSSMEWTPSPAAGVERIILERESSESGRATSIVRYAPNTSFKSHTHPGGEEILVLSGEFKDENGTYPAGTYFRYPPGSSHTPGSTVGCVLFVKLNHFKTADNQTLKVETTKEPWRQGHGGLQVMPLHQFETEGTALVKWPAGEKFLPHRHWGGEEIFVLTGEFCDEHGRYPAGTWIRSPHLSMHHPFVEQETIILVKTGHLI
jgi:anti-sigma factor ChrR (cupin superfamily)